MRAGKTNIRARVLPSSAPSRLLAHLEKCTICVGTTPGGVADVWGGNIHGRTQDD
jgi:hypothetical protein